METPAATAEWNGDGAKDAPQSQLERQAITAHRAARYITRARP
jgi:hypothetical protein